MPKYTLTYFNLRGRAELTRLMFEAAGVAYEDRRVEFEDWPKAKADTLFGYLPVLEVEGEGSLSESTAIARYVAKELGYEGTTGFEQAKADMAVCALDDLQSCTIRNHFEPDEERKKRTTMELHTNKIPPILKALDAVASGKTFVGDSLTIADFAIFDFCYLMKDELDTFPKLQEIVENVASVPGVASWVAKRPESFL